MTQQNNLNPESSLPAEQSPKDLIIQMNRIVKTFNIGQPNELEILHASI